jgi:hypothetical protein
MKQNCSEIRGRTGFASLSPIVFGNAAAESTTFAIGSGSDTDFVFADLTSLNATSTAGDQTWLTATGHASTAFAAGVATTTIASTYTACNCIATTERAAIRSLHYTPINIAALFCGAITITPATTSTTPSRMDPMPDMSQTLSW